MLLFRPDGPARSVEFADMLVHPNALGAPDAEKSVDEVFKFWDMVNAQDILAVERVHIGLQSKAYPGGRMCYRFEEPVHRYQNMVIDRMVGKHRIPPGDAQEDPAWLEVLKADEPKPKPLVGSKKLKMAAIVNA
jgi:choline monooxygenase